jgi:hypothetical protein
VPGRRERRIVSMVERAEGRDRCQVRSLGLRRCYLVCMLNRGSTVWRPGAPLRAREAALELDR